MWNRPAVVVGVVSLIVAIFYAGLVVGRRQGFGWMLEVQETEVAGALNHEVSALTLIRAGYQEKALRLLETRVATATTTLPQDREWSELGDSQRQSLLLAKTYFAKYPSQSHTGESLEHFHEALARIPDEPLDPKWCSSEVQSLLEGDQ